MGELSPALYRAGEGEPVVLLHGATGSWRHWRPVLADLAARFEVIAPTLAGHDGGPVPSSETFTVTDAADSLETHLDELGVGTAHLVGNSLGGLLAIELAKRGRAQSIVAISPAAGWEPGAGEGERLARFFGRTIRASRLTAARADTLLRSAWARRVGFRETMRHGERMTPSEAADLVRSTARFSLVDELMYGLRHEEASLPKDLDQVAVPVLLAWAERDRVVPAATCSSRFRREIPGAEFRLLPRTGHVPMWDDPDLIVDTIVEWASRHAGPNAAA